MTVCNKPPQTSMRRTSAVMLQLVLVSPGGAAASCGIRSASISIRHDETGSVDS